MTGRNINLRVILTSHRTSGIEPVYQEHYTRRRVRCNQGAMPVKSISTWEEIKTNVNDRIGLHEVIFVNGKPYEGEASFGRYKGFGWESGRTASIYITPPVDPASEVILVDLRYLRLRRCQLRVLTDRIDIKIAEDNNQQEWDAVDLPEDKK